MSSEFCGPCPEVECLDVTEEDAAALKSLYQRMLDNSQQCNSGPAPGSTSAASKFAKSSLTSNPACKDDGSTSKSLLQRMDLLMTAALDSRTAGTSDNANDKAALPDAVLFAKCRPLPPGKLNTVLYGMDVERAVVGPSAERDDLTDAVDALLKAEAACKHGGAVQAAEMAAMSQPEAKHAEDAARIGAKAYTTADGGKKGGSNSEYPVVVVGYVGCTKPPRTDAATTREKPC